VKGAGERTPPLNKPRCGVLETKLKQETVGEEERGSAGNTGERGYLLSALKGDCTVEGGDSRHLLQGGLWRQRGRGAILEGARGGGSLAD